MPVKNFADDESKEAMAAYFEKCHQLSNESSQRKNNINANQNQTSVSSALHRPVPSSCSFQHRRDASKPKCCGSLTQEDLFKQDMAAFATTPANPLLRRQLIDWMEHASFISVVQLSTDRQQNLACSKMLHESHFHQIYLQALIEICPSTINAHVYFELEFQKAGQNVWGYPKTGFADIVITVERPREKSRDVIIVELKVSKNPGEVLHDECREIWDQRTMVSVVPSSDANQHLRICCHRNSNPKKMPLSQYLLEAPMAQASNYAHTFDNPCFVYAILAAFGAPQVMSLSATRDVSGRLSNFDLSALRRTKFGFAFEHDSTVFPT